MKRSRIRKNNRGDSLILVIGCIALLSIVGVILLAKTMDNRNMKLAEEQAQASFAGAESGSAEMVTAIETAALTTIENAFGDMLLEYSVLADGDARKARYKDFFREKMIDMLTTGGTFQEQLEAALGASVTNLTVEFDGDVEPDPVVEAGYTETIRAKDVKFTYSIGDSQTKITTDICIKAQLPDIEAGFSSGISCDFLDFALITDGTVTVSDTTDMVVEGNMYVGGDLITTGSNVATKVSKAKKMLVKKEMKIEPGASVWVTAGSGVTMSEGEGIWAGGISVNGGTLDTTDVNLYVRDDLSVEGKTPNVVLRGNNSEYVGYSGNAGGSVNHERSSAIIINEIDLADIDGDGDKEGLVLDLSALGDLYINGNSYICENNNNWGGDLVDGNISAAEGVLQGETIAYKDMQAMYLFPGSCLNKKHNPIIGSLNVNEISVTSLMYSFHRDGQAEQTWNLEPYLDSEHPFVTRTARLDNGATVATYVYLNFKGEKEAAQYVRDYLNTFLGDSIKDQINNLESVSKIDLPTNTLTLSNAIEFSGTSLTVHPSATDVQKTLLNISGLLAQQRYNGLFSSLRAEGGSAASDSYQMLQSGILNMSAFEALPPGEEKEILIPGTNYSFIAYNGDLTIQPYSKYANMQGILLVNGNLKLSTSPVTVNGLVLATGDVTQAAGAQFIATKDAVETLLANEEVAKFFQVYGAESGHGYLSTEAVEISFDKWKKN